MRLEPDFDKFNSLSKENKQILCVTINIKYVL